MYFTSFFQALAVVLSLSALIGTVESVPTFVNLGSCKPFAVVAGATITNDGYSVVNGDIALSPGSAVVGFPPGEVVGIQHITDGAAALCIGDLGFAITNANSRVADMSMTGELGGMRLSPGVYKSIAGYSITNILYLDGQNDPDAAWIFVMATTLTVNAGASVVMLNYDDTNGVSVWWSCADRADILVGASMQGTIMAHQNIAVGTGATTGPLMASLGEVTLLSNSVVAYPALQQQTPKPSRAPTRSPTTSKGKAPRVALSVDQKVTGATSEDYEQDKPAIDLTLQHALASILTGVDPKDVTGISCKDANTFNPSPDSCLLSYKIASYDPDMTYEKLAAQLIKGAATGKLMRAIRQYAATYGAEEMEAVTVTAPQVQNADDAEKSDTLDLSTGGAVGVAIAGLVVFLFIVAMFFYCCCHSTKQPHTAQEGAEVQRQPVTTA